MHQGKKPNRLFFALVRSLFTLGVLGTTGCVAHNSACLNMCLDQHRLCVTNAQTAVQLDECDQAAKRCKADCR